MSDDNDGPKLTRTTVIKEQALEVQGGPENLHKV